MRFLIIHWKKVFALLSLVGVLALTAYAVETMGPSRYGGMPYETTICDRVDLTMDGEYDVFVCNGEMYAIVPLDFQPPAETARIE